MPALASVPAANTDDILSYLERDGACIALDALPETLCDTLLADFKPHLEEIAAGADDLGYREQFYGQQTKRLHGLFSRSAAMETVLLQPVLQALCQRLFIDTGLASDVRLSNAELMALHQGQDQQVFHSDAASWRHAQEMAPNELLLSANYALTAFTRDNGATCVVPGSHRWPGYRQPQPEEICQAIMPRGSALIYTGNVIHAGGANSTAHARCGLYMGYMVSWLRPLENYLVTNRSEDIRSLSARAQTLLDVTPSGFTVYA